MTLFGTKTAQRNILILGNNGCGQRSFILHYKDGIAASDQDLPELKNIIYKKKLEANRYIDLNFTLDRASDELIPSAAVKTKFDLILVLVDLSSEQAKKDLSLHTQHAQTHFPGVATLTIGTKADKQLKTNAFNNIVMTSAKTGVGFDQFDAALCAIVNPPADTNSCKLM